MKYITGPRIQQGRGLGGLLRGLVRTFKPISRVVSKAAKNPVLRKIGKRAADTALDIVSDTLEGQNIKDSSQRRINEAKADLAQVIRNRDSHKNTPRRRRLQRQPKKAVRKRYRRPIFDE